MSNIIFAQPRHEYDSYSDLRRLITLSGYPLIYIDEIDAASDNVYIFSTPDTHWFTGVERVGWPDARARIIYYNIEWYPDVNYQNIPGVEVWSADKWHAESIGARYVPLGSHAGLNPCPQDLHMPTSDVIMLSYMTNRRMQMAVWLGDKDISIAPQGWSEERHRALLSAKAMLHVHQNDGIATVAPQRFALAAAYGLPMISEALADGGIFGYTHALYADYAYLPDIVKIWKDDHRLVDYGLALNELLCHQHTFNKCIEAAL